MKNSLFALGLFLIWLGSYIGYPLWHLPQENLRGVVFGIFLIFFAINFLALDRFVSSLKLDREKLPYPSIKKEKIIWWSGVIYFLLQVYPMTMPVLSRNDEEHYLTCGLLYYLKLCSFWERYFRVPWGWFAWIFIFLFIFIIAKRKFWMFFLRKKKLFMAFFLSMAAIIYYLILARYSSIDSFFYLFRFPGLFKVFYVLGYSLFGIKEFGPRLIQAVLGFLSAVYLYKLVSLYRHREVAIFSFIVWLFMPACIFFGNLAFLTNGLSFFLISSFYYLLAHHRDKTNHSLFLGVVILCIGTMYKHPVIIALFIYYLYLIFLIISRKASLTRDKAMLILPAWLVLVTALPYLIITRFIYVPFDYPFSLTGLVSKSAHLEQIRLTLSGISGVHILFLTIGVIVTIRRKDIFSLFAFIWFMSYFFFQIIYQYNAFRLIVPYFPVLAIWTAEGLGAVVKKDKIFKGVMVLILAYAVASSTFLIVPPISPRLMLYHKISSRYLPYPEAILYLKENLSPDERCLSPGHSSPEKFYCLKFGLPLSKIDHAWWWAGGTELQTGDNLYEYAKSHKIKFCLFPSGDWPRGFLNPDLRERLVRGEDERFILERVFLSGENSLYFFKVR